MDVLTCPKNFALKPGCEMTPPVIPLSNPNRRPPEAATKAMMITAGVKHRSEHVLDM
jgi:hypothetical protein